MIWFLISAALMTITAAIHSIAGESRLLGPLLSMNEGVMASRQGRHVLRSAWHLTSILMLSNAVVVAWPNVDWHLKSIIGSFWIIMGLFSLVASRGKHVGWPWLSGAGLTAFIGSVL